MLFQIQVSWKSLPVQDEEKAVAGFYCEGGDAESHTNCLYVIIQTATRESCSAVLTYGQMVCIHHRGGVSLRSFLLSAPHRPAGCCRGHSTQADYRDWTAGRLTNQKSVTLLDPGRPKKLGDFP